MKALLSQFSYWMEWILNLLVLQPYGAAPWVTEHVPVGYINEQEHFVRVQTKNFGEQKLPIRSLSSLYQIMDIQRNQPRGMLEIQTREGPDGLELRLV